MSIDVQADDKVVSLSETGKRKKQVDAKPDANPPSVDRLAYLALEDEICQLRTASELLVDINISDNPCKERQADWVADQIERLADQLFSKYHGHADDED
jgi:hypothetical protein